MTSADFSRQALLRRPLGTTSVRPPRVRTRSFPSSIRRIYTSGPCSYWASSCLADLPTLVCLMRFLFVGPTVCLGLLSDPASRRTPLPPAMRLALPPALGTFTLKKRAHAEHTKKGSSQQRRPFENWWLGTESNRRHADFQSAALPTELPSPNSSLSVPKDRRVVARDGIEPPTRGFSIRCSTN